MSIFELCVEEKDEELRRLSLKRNTALLAIIASHVPQQSYPYYTELRAPEEFGVEHFVEQARKSSVCDKLSLLLQSYGGSINSAYIIAKTLRRNFRHIAVYIPQFAISAATLIAICGDEIVMGELSRISPLDVKLLAGDRYESVLAFTRCFKKLVKKFHERELPSPYRQLLSGLSIAAVEEKLGILYTIREYARDILKMAKYTENSARRIAKILTTSPSYYAIIDYDKAREIGLRVVWYKERREVWDTMRKWLAKYILRRSYIHHMAYVLPS